MISRKRYVYSDSSIPRRTQYRRRIRERQRLTSQIRERVLTDKDNYKCDLSEPRACEEISPSGKNSSDSPICSESTQDGQEEIILTCQTFTERNSEHQFSPYCGVDVQCTSEKHSSDASESGGTKSEDEKLDSVSSASDSELENEHYVNIEVEDLADDSDSVCESSASENDNSNEQGDNKLLNNPLSESTKTTEGDAMIMCLALGLRHSLTWAAIVDILAMINCLFNREVVKPTKHLFLKYMDAGKNGTVFHLFCPTCERYLGTKEAMSDFVACVCGTKLLDIQEASTYFLSLSLEQQIKDFLNDRKFVEALDYRFRRKKMKEEAYEDLFDAEVYRSHCEPGGILRERYNFSYTMNTDGFPVGGKSGKQTCWPIYIQINELPPELRSKYMILAGIYVGKKDPNMKIFMYPFVEEANALSSVGITWTHNGKEINSKIIPLCVCVDSPARAKLLNMNQFNGWYGCSICYCKAESVRDCGGLRYTNPPNGLEERTHKEILTCAAEAYANRQSERNQKKWSVKGVKGLTPIHTLNYLDLVKGVRPDTMHSKLLGNVNHHTSMFYDCAGKAFYIGSDIRKNAVSTRLLSIKPPSSIMRPPRGLQYLTNWKATEWRSWALFYGVVCLYGIIPNEYVLHFSMLSSSLHIILQKSITREDLETAHVLLLRYVSLYQEYFGKCAMVFNVHLLLHTKRDVECLGPAWTNTAFAFEGANKNLLQLKKGTACVAKEIARKYQIFRALPVLIERYATSDQALKFCESLSGRRLKSFLREGKAVLVGNGIPSLLTPEEFYKLKQSMFCDKQEVLSFEKMIMNGIRYCTGSYSRSGKHDDSYICVRNDLRGRIEKLYYISEKGIVIFVREMIISRNPLFEDAYGRLSPVQRIESEGQLVVIRPEDISTQCVAMFLDHGNFICDMPFGCYSHS